MDKAKEAHERTTLLGAMSKEAYNVGKQRSIGRWKVLPGYTDDNSTVWQNYSTGSIVIAYRGTDPTRRGDLEADLLIAGDALQPGAHKHSKRFKAAKAKYDLIRSNFKDSKITLTGHSLGGGQAMYVNAMTNTETEVFNPGYTNPRFWNNSSDFGENLTVNSVFSDVVSAGARLGGFLKGKKGVTFRSVMPRSAQDVLKQGVHGLDNWVTDEDLEEMVKASVQAAYIPEEGRPTEDDVPNMFFKAQGERNKNTIGFQTMVHYEDRREKKRERMQAKDNFKKAAAYYHDPLSRFKHSKVLDTA